MSRLSRDGLANNSSDAHDLIGAALQFQPIFGEGASVPVPPLDYAEAEDEEAATAAAELLAYEMEPEAWHPVSSGGQAKHSPTRFVDGSLFSVTAGVCKVNDVRRPLVLASMGAAEMFLDGRHLYRPREGYRVVVAAAMVSNGIATRLLDKMRDELFGLGIHLIAFETTDVATNFERLRRRTWDILKQEMEGLEREILLSRPDTPTLADGLLERRLTSLESQRQPVVGMVKRNLRQYLPDSLAMMLYELDEGERSPAFVIQTPHAELVSWYLRLSGGSPSPGAGVIRLAMSRRYLEAEFSPELRFEEISGISRDLCSFHCREESYARHQVSLEPIIRLEDQLRALLPPVNSFASRLRRHLSRT